MDKDVWKQLEKLVQIYKLNFNMILFYAVAVIASFENNIPYNNSCS